ncbi:MAG: glycoside hydrolase family 3 N-terminal domain-containing protein, partial [Bacteroidota bacterium]
MKPFILKQLASVFLAVFLLIGISAQAQSKQDPNEQRIQDMLDEMNTIQKIGQLNMRGTSSRVKGKLSESLKQAVREGRVGTMLNVMNKDYVDELQRIAVEESPQGIPIIFARDVIHGFKTIFPIPLGIAATWNSESARISSEIAAHEATGNGIRWTFAPMLDITRDSRWGRIAESPGEDPYLAGVMAEAYIKGFQGEDLSNPKRMAACAKHFMGYGAPIGGRDYNTANIPEPLMRNIYLPPFENAIEAGAATVMSSFNELNGVPVTGSRFMLTDVLRGELGFDGFVVSDWHSVIEMIPHGFAEDQKHAAQLAANAGMEVEMMSTAYEDHLEALIKEGIVSEVQLDNLVANVLRIKFRLGLFDQPYRDKNHDGDLYDEKHLAEAQKMAAQSMVLLKNDGVLPLDLNKRSVALIGPLMDKPREQLGTWTFDGDGEFSVTPKDAFSKAKVVSVHAEGLEFSRDRSQKGFEAAVDAAKAADYVVFVG